MTRIFFGPWLPDQPAFANDWLRKADGVVAIAGGYGPIAGFVPMRSGMLGARCIGAGGYRHADAPYLFVATTTNIYTYSSAGYVSVASGMAGARDLGVRFCPYGAYMLATNGVDPIKKFDPAFPSAMTSLGGSAPTARYLGVVRGFVVAGYAGGSGLRLAWSDNGNSANWAAGGASEAGQYDMASGGDITGVVGGEYGLVFQEDRILRMTYTADDIVWQFDEIVTDAGCAAPKSLASWGKTSFFWSNRGFMTCDGANVQPIGDEKVDRTFRSLIDRGYYGAMSAVVDPIRTLYIVAVPSADPTTNLFLYNYGQERWTTATLACELLFSALSLSSSLEDLDTLYASIDTDGLVLDSAALRGGVPGVMVFDGTHRLGTLSGPPIAATITDATRELVPGTRSRIRGVRPLVDAVGATICVAGANRLSEALTETSYSAARPNGTFRCRENWNLTRVTLSIPAGTAWSSAQGYDVDAVAGGRP